MSGALAAIRADLKTALTGKVSVDGRALDVQDVFPEVLQAPALYLLASNPYLTPAAGLPTGVLLTRWDVLVTLAQGTAPTVQARYEAAAEQVLDAIFSDDTHDWTVLEVGSPELVTLTPQMTTPAVRVKVTRPARITTPTP